MAVWVASAANANAYLRAVLSHRQGVAKAQFGMRSADGRLFGLTAWRALKAEVIPQRVTDVGGTEQPTLLKEWNDLANEDI